MNDDIQTGLVLGLLVVSFVAVAMGKILWGDEK